MLEWLRCSTPFHFCTDSLPPSLWVPSPLNALQSCRGSGYLVAVVVPVSFLPPSPPPPFPVQPYLSRYPPDQRESIFVVILLALSPSVPPGLGPIDLLSAVRALFHVQPPRSYVILVFHLYLALNRHIAVI